MEKMRRVKSQFRGTGQKMVSINNMPVGYIKFK
jgi:hypothetical protein